MQLGRSLRDRMDRTLDAEMEAARCAARRRRSLRDRLLDAEDCRCAVTITTCDGTTHRGMIDGVGSDHIDLVGCGSRRILATQHIALLEVVS